MKKSNRIKLAIVTSAMIATSVLLPLVLTSCSQPTGIASVNERLSELSKPENKAIRKSIYSGYASWLNKNPTQQPPTRPMNRLIGLPDVPHVTDFGVNLRLFDINKKSEFINQMIDMIDTGLEVGNGYNCITNLQKSKLMEEMRTVANALISDDIGFSTIGTNAFMFDDINSASWSFGSLKDGIEYKLYLTPDVDFKYQMNGGKATVSVDNLCVSLTKRVRLSIISSPALDVTATDHNYDFYFKPGIIKLPSLLFRDFSTYFSMYNMYVDNFYAYFNQGANRYKDIVNEGFVNGATLWNQFMLSQSNLIQQELQKDLIENRSNAKLITWLKSNCESLAIINELASNLDKAANVSLWFSPLLIQGDNISPEYLNNYSSPYPRRNRININLSSPANPSYNNWEYTIDLYPTSFQFTSQLNRYFGFTSNPWLISYPVVKFHKASCISSYKRSNDNNGQPIVFTNKIKANTEIDASSLFNINLSIFLSNLLQAGPSNSTATLIARQHNPKIDSLLSFKNYLTTSQGYNLLRSSALSSFIFDNIDLNSMAYTTDINGVADFKQIHQETWRRQLNYWLQSYYQNAPTISVQTTATNTTTIGAQATIKISARDANSGLVVRAWDNPNQPPYPSNLTLTFTNIYIHIGSQSSVDNVIANTVNMNNNYPYGTIASNLFINPKSVFVPNTPQQVQDEATLLSKLTNHIWVVFQEIETTGNQLTNGPLYAFYMGQRPNNQTFPITVPNGLINTHEFYSEFTKLEPTVPSNPITPNYPYPYA